MSDVSAYLRSESELTAPDVAADRWLEYLTGAHSTKPGFYGEWNRTAQGLQHSLKALREISVALCTTTDGPDALARAVVAAAASQFESSWAVMTLGQEVVARQAPLMGSTGNEHLEGGQSAQRAPGSPGDDAASSQPAWHILTALASKVQEHRTTMAVVTTDRSDLRFVEAAIVTDLWHGIGAPMVINQEAVGSLVVLLPTAAPVDPSSLSILGILANQAAVAFQNAILYQQSKELEAKAVQGWMEATRVAVELRRTNRKLKRARNDLTRASRQRLLDEERNRIAGELHDNVIQYLVSIGMDLEWCRRSASTKDPALMARLEATQELGREALARVRKAISELSCIGGDGDGLIPVLERLTLGIAGQLEVDLRVRGDVRRLPAQVEHVLFHGVQEALFNCVRHAACSKAWVDLRVFTQQVCLSVVDDGTGSPSTLSKYLGSPSEAKEGVPGGLATMRARVCALGGRLRVSARSGGGVRLFMSLPISEKHDCGSTRQDAPGDLGPGCVLPGSRASQL